MGATLLALEDGLELALKLLGLLNGSRRDLLLLLLGGGCLGLFFLGGGCLNTSGIGGSEFGERRDVLSLSDNNGKGLHTKLATRHPTWESSPYPPNGDILFSRRHQDLC